MDQLYKVSFSFYSLGLFYQIFYRFRSHHFIVSCPLSNSAMISFYIHLSLKDFILSDLSSFSFLRILTYSNSILLFISATHLLLSWAGWFSFSQITLLFLFFHNSQAVLETIILYLSVACLLYFPSLLLILRLLIPLRSASLGITQSTPLLFFMGILYSFSAISHIFSLPSIVHENSMWSMVSNFWK